jgi:hypothetical protein
MSELLQNRLDPRNVNAVLPVDLRLKSDHDDEDDDDDDDDLKKSDDEEDDEEEDDGYSE